MKLRDDPRAARRTRGHDAHRRPNAVDLHVRSVIARRANSSALHFDSSQCVRRRDQSLPERRHEHSLLPSAVRAAGSARSGRHDARDGSARPRHSLSEHRHRAHDVDAVGHLRRCIPHGAGAGERAEDRRDFRSATRAASPTGSRRTSVASRSDEGPGGKWQELTCHGIRGSHGITLKRHEDRECLTITASTRFFSSCATVASGREPIAVFRALRAFRVFRGSAVPACRPVARFASRGPEIRRTTGSRSTEHFFVHFTPPTEGLARRIAADAERAYAELAQQLHPPRGMIDVVISDDVDVIERLRDAVPDRIASSSTRTRRSRSRRFATRTTGDSSSSRHELTHIFHLDRTRGIWSLGQHVFGRAAALFPNFYIPSWLTEGLAVYEESRIAGAGRIEGSEHRMIARAAAIDHTFPSIGAISLAHGRFPFGESAYALRIAVHRLSRAHAGRIARPVVRRQVGGDIVPYLFDIPAKQAFGVTFTRAWRSSRDSVARSRSASRRSRRSPAGASSRATASSCSLRAGSPIRRSSTAARPAANRSAPFASTSTAGARASAGATAARPNVPLGNGRISLLADRLRRSVSLSAPISGSRPRQARAPADLRPASHQPRRARRRARSSPSRSCRARRASCACRATARRFTPITGGSYDEQWTEPRWSHRRRLHRRRRAGCAATFRKSSSSTRSAGSFTPCRSGARFEATPSWSARRLAASSTAPTEPASAQLYFKNSHGYGFAEPRTFRVSDVDTGLFEPNAAPRADRLAAVLFRADGYHLGVGSCCATGSARRHAAERVRRISIVTAATDVAPVIVDTSAAKQFSPWRTLFPRYWLPKLDPGIDGGYRIGASTSGIDVIGRHAFTANLSLPDEQPRRNHRQRSPISIPAFGLPIIQLDASQDWESLGGIFARNAQRAPARRALSPHLERRRARHLDSPALPHVDHRSPAARASNAGTTSRRRRGPDPEHRHHRRARHARLPQPRSPARVSQTTQRPPFSISPEDGVSLSTTVRDRLTSGATASAGRASAPSDPAAIYKSLDLPGFAHHVLALRGAGGWADDNANGYFSVGGVSGNTFQIIPGYVLGEGRKTFPVRGFRARHARSARARSPDRPSIACRCSCSAARPESSAVLLRPHVVHAVRRLRHRVVSRTSRPAGRCATQPGQCTDRVDIGIGRRGAEPEPRRVLVGRALPLPRWSSRTPTQNVGRQSLQFYMIGGISFDVVPEERATSTPLRRGETRASADGGPRTHASSG